MPLLLARLMPWLALLVDDTVANVAEKAPVVKLVDVMIRKALEDRASDIHIEPGERKLNVRFRIDGELYEVLNPPVAMSSAITRMWVGAPAASRSR